MYIHNTTFIVERSIETTFTDWARTVFIPAARDSHRFTSVTMARILTEVQPEAVNIAVQMTSTSLDDATRWHQDVASLLKDDLRARLGDRVMFFSTDMEIIESI